MVGSTSPTGRTTASRCGGTDDWTPVPQKWPDGGTTTWSSRTPFRFTAQQFTARQQEYTTSQFRLERDHENAPEGTEEAVSARRCGRRRVLPRGGAGLCRQRPPRVHRHERRPRPAIKITDAGQGRCASCHRAHTARAAYLLNATSEESLCYSCHGDGGTGATTDVQSGLGYDAAATTTYPNGTTLTVDRGTTVAGTLRGGGFEKAALGTGAATKEIYLSGTELRTVPQPAGPAG